MRKILLLGIALALMACGRDDTVGPAPSISGSYNLTAVDEQVLPVTLLDLGAYRVLLTSGTLALNSDGTYSLELGHRTLDSGNIRTGAHTDAGNWEVVGNVLSLASTQGGISRTGTVSGGAITLQSSVRLFLLRN